MPRGEIYCQRKKILSHEEFFVTGKIFFHRKKFLATIKNFLSYEGISNHRNISLCAKKLIIPYSMHTICCLCTFNFIGRKHGSQKAKGHWFQGVAYDALNLPSQIRGKGAQFCMFLRAFFEISLKNDIKSQNFCWAKFV